MKLFLFSIDKLTIWLYITDYKGPLDILSTAMTSIKLKFGYFIYLYIKLFQLFLQHHIVKYCSQVNYC